MNLVGKKCMVWLCQLRTVKGQNQNNLLNVESIQGNCKY